MPPEDTRGQLDTPPAARQAPERRRYLKPSILHRQPIEAMAAECGFPGGKTDPTCAVGFS